MAQQEIDLRGTGLDTDSDIRVMLPGDSDYRLNTILDTSNDNSLGNAQNDWGFLLQDTYQGVPADYKVTDEVIGTAIDSQNNAIVYMVCDTTAANNHYIVRWYAYTGINELIVQSPILNFQRSFKINHANIINGELLYTDNYVNPANTFDYNGPRKFNLEKARLFTNGLPGGYTVFDLQTIDAIKYPPTKSPVCSFNSVALQQSLFIGKYLQPMYRFVYDDNEKSVFSPWAPILISQAEDANGNIPFAVDNQIEIILQTGHETVSKLEVGSKINNAFYIIQVLDKAELGIPSNSTYTYLYNGDRIEYALDPKEVFKTQDYNPQVAGAQEIVLNSTLVYANNLEGYETPVTNLSATVKLKKATATAPIFATPDYGNNINYRALSLKRNGIYRIGVIHMDKQGRCAPVDSPDTAQVQIPFWKLSSTDPLYTANFDLFDEWINTLNQKPYIEWSLTSTPPIWAYSYIIVCTKDIRDTEKTISFVQWGAGLGDEDGIFQNKKTTLLIPSTAGYSFEQGDRIRLVAEYVDWQSTAPGNEYGNLGMAQVALANVGFGGGVYQQRLVDTYDTTPPANSLYDFQIQKFNQATGRVEISGEITDLRPECAYIWEIYNPTRVTTSSEIFYGVGQEYDITDATLPTRAYSVTAGVIEGIDVYHRWKKIVWKPQRVKFKSDFVGYPVTPPIDPTNNEHVLQVGNLTTTTFKKSVGDVPSPVPFSIGASKTSAEIKGWKDQAFGTTVNGNWISFNMFYEPASPVPGAGGPPVPNYSVTDSTIININSGAMGPQNAFALVSTVFSPAGISNLSANKCAQLAFVPVLLMEGGQTTIEFDTWNNPDLNTANDDFDSPSFDIFILTEDHSISDFYESNLDSTGKGYEEDPLAERKRYFADLRHSGKLLQETQINNLLSFDFENRTFVQEKDNEITRIREVGFMLDIRQRNRTSAMYIGRKEYQDATGTVDVVASQNVFGSINPSEEDFGSYHPAGDIKATRDRYFFDVTMGQVVRNSVNGQIAISGNKESADDPYKMKKFFYDLAKLIRENNAQFEVLGNWDEFIESYVLTVRDLRKRVEGNDVPDASVTLIFHEPTNRWKSFMSYVPEWYAKIGNTTVSFKDGKLWKHYADENNRGTYYGVSYDQQIAIICNIGYNTKKVFTNIDLDSNVAWDCDITIPANSTYPQGMKSRIKKGKFVSREGKFSASFGKDMLTPGIVSQDLALVNGRELRGEAMRVLLTNNERTFVYLRQCTIWVEQSELTQ